MNHTDTKRLLMFNVFLMLILITALLHSSPYSNGNLLTFSDFEQEKDTHGAQQTDQENPFQRETELDFYRSKALLKDFKIMSFGLFLVGGIVAVIFSRRFLHTKLPKIPFFSLLTAFFIQYVVLILLNIGLYILAVHYEWFGFHLLDRAAHDSGLWPEIQKTLSLGLGSFYVAHVIDAFIVSLVIFFLLAILIAQVKGKAR